MDSWDLCVKDVKNILYELKKFQKNYTVKFQTKTRNLKEQALQYLHGKFLERGRGNMTSYAKFVPETNNQRLQNFISDSPWDEKPVIEQIQTDVIKLIGDRNCGAIHIDESGFKKDGKDSVGVRRQYCGRLGKIENCRVGVYLGYTNGNRRTLIDERLYLPGDWAKKMWGSC
jgi:SRSO17 transposase